MTYEHFLEEYRRKLRTPEEAVSVVKDGDGGLYLFTWKAGDPGSCIGET